MARWPEIDWFLQGRGVRISTPTLCGTTGCKHAAGSFHYLGLARDYGTVGSDCWAVYRTLLPYAQNGTLAELFWDPSGTGWKYGRNIGPIGGHSDHVHAALDPRYSLPSTPFAQLPPQADWFDMATKADLHAVLEERGFNKYETRDFHAILNTRGLNDFERKDVHDVVENTLREHGLIP